MSKLRESVTKIRSLFPSGDAQKAAASEVAAGDPKGEEEKFFGAVTQGMHVPLRPTTPPLGPPALMRILPWITDGAIEYIDTFLGEKRLLGEPVSAIECGSGSSTGYLAQRVAQLVSFETDANWHAAVRTAMGSIGVSNVVWRTMEPPYSRAFKEYQDEAFDILLVDGGDRNLCVEHGRRLVKPGGILVVDNSERISGVDGQGPYYDILGMLEDWHAVHFEQVGKDRAGWVPPHRWITSVWCKPIPGAKRSFTTLGLPL